MWSILKYLISTIPQNCGSYIVYGCHIEKYECLLLIIFSAIQTMLVSAEMQEEYITTIDSSNFNSSFPHQAIQIPLELVRLFTDSSVHDSGEVRVISSFFNNVEDLFPNGRPGINKYD